MTSTLHIPSVSKLSLVNSEWPDYIPLPGGKLFQLESRHVYKMLINAQYSKQESELFMVTLEIPKWFLTDKRSAPQVLWAVRPRDGRSEIASLIHDALYRTAGNTKNLFLGVECTTDVPVNNTMLTFSRKACDQIYRIAYEKTAPEMKDEAARDYFWLRVFGRLHFGKKIPPAGQKG